MYEHGAEYAARLLATLKQDRRLVRMLGPEVTRCLGLLGGTPFAELDSSYVARPSQRKPGSRLELDMLKDISWQDVCKFLAGAFFVSTGVLFYLYLADVSVPLLGTSFIATPGINGVRSIVNAVFFVTFFYLGFLQKR